VRLLEMVNDLFAIDTKAHEQNIDLAARDALRQQKAKPLLDQIKVRLLEGRDQALPKSCFGKACRYTIKLWNKLTRFLEPELELSNNLAENFMRPLALGRRNWIHLGDEQAGPRVAAILSVIESCRRSAEILKTHIEAEFAKEVESGDDQTRLSIRSSVRF
jgi:transposase